MRITGRTSKNLRDIIAEFVLGLSGDVLSDKDLPFSERLSWGYGRRGFDMKDIDGLSKVLDTLEPHWETVRNHFDRRNEYFLNLTSSDHDALGRVLKAHLAIEAFLDDFLTKFYSFNEFHDFRLSFNQKAQMIPPNGIPASWLRPGILQLNRARNNFGHKAGYKLGRHEITAIYEVLAVARTGIDFAEPADAIEAFAAIACAFLDVPPRDLEHVFAEAFANIRTHDA